MLILATIARWLQMTLLPSQAVLPNPPFTLCAKNGVWIQMKRRAFSLGDRINTLC